MAASKTSRTILASASNTAGSTATGTESNQSTAYGCLVCGKITNGGTGPTIGCDFVVYVGESTGVKREFSRQTATTASGAVADFCVLVPPPAMFINVTFTGNTGQAVTVESYLQELTSI
jgi:hypothetical protein